MARWFLSLNCFRCRHRRDRCSLSRRGETRHDTSSASFLLQGDRRRSCFRRGSSAERLKKVGLLRRHTDKVRDSPEGAPERGFEWLWSRLERTILEGQQEQNMISIQEALRKGPKKETPGVPEEARADSPRERGAREPGHRSRCWLQRTVLPCIHAVRIRYIDQDPCAA